MLLTTGTQRIRDWYYHHGKESTSKSSGPAPSPLKVSRRPRTLAPHQAYGILFCGEDSTLHAELRSEWDLFKAGDKEIIAKYRHLFSHPISLDMKFVTFQQNILKDCMALITEEETQQVQELIKTRREEATVLHDNPWLRLKVDEVESNSELQRRFITE